MAPSQLQIKSSALQRLLKEKKLYQEEVEESDQTIIKYQAQLVGEPGNEELEYTLKNAIKIRDETKRLLPSIDGKIQEILTSLKEYLKSEVGESSEETTNLIKAAELELKS
ncbi:hypothetical protein CANARDRAFT_28120 [[Candida] arabinofermentans NRRL YB-2248]|uniref:Tubulin-specific chaperone A n=1 Tax=[Candida] arabinofermentans NRRL YB-2248 TaxID=983967 RepID=A0A1E4T2W1_9ASCO|nr:hypothetical protein CANARDRAFT_28120 [[Candida] arabinofermentans NRRL YB-2248]